MNMEKDRKKAGGRAIAILMILMMTLSLMTGCINTEGDKTESEEKETGTGNAVHQVEYDPEDLDDSWDPETAVNISLAGNEAKVNGDGARWTGSELTITEAGTYVLEGTLNDGQVVIEAGEKDLIRLVLNGTNLSSSDSSVIQVDSADKVVLILADGTENTVSDGSGYATEEDSDIPDGAIYSKADLAINGTGFLLVKGNSVDGITGKDDLVIAGGNLEVVAVRDGIRGKDSIAIKDGNITLQAGDEGLQATNDEDSEKGWVSIDGGSIKIKAEGDGIKAESWLQVNNGNIKILKSAEGLEGTSLTINGGELEIHAADDGLNVPDQAGEMVISGGRMIVSAEGDGLDSNGTFSMTGGTVLVYGPLSSGNGALDYDREGSITGGTLLMAGSAGMIQLPGETSTQMVLSVGFDQWQEAGTVIALRDSTGAMLAEFAPEKKFQWILISTPDMEQDSQVTLSAGGRDTLTTTLSQVITSLAQDGSVLQQQRGGMPMGDSSARPEGFQPRPEGEEGFDKGTGRPQAPPEQ